MSHIFVVTGEKSGDEQAARLLQSCPSLTIEGVIGPCLRSCGAKEFLPMESLQVMGFIDVLIHLRRLFSIMKKITSQILAANPPVVLLVDYPGLNLTIASKLRKKGFKGKIIQLGCPSVWAWKKKRIQKMEQSLDLLLTFFPFEPPLFTHTKLKALFIGHPLAQTFLPTLLQEREAIVLFPGSRKKEIERNLPLQLQVVKKLFSLDPKTPFFFSLSDPAFRLLYENLIAKANLPKSLVYTIVTSHQEILPRCRAAIAKSGTITLELALMGIPTVVMYAISKLDVWLAQKVFKINLPYYCIVNILFQEMVFPEFFGPNCTVENIFQAVLSLHVEPEKFQNIKNLLQSPYTDEEKKGFFLPN